MPLQIGRTLIDRARIRQRVGELGRALASDLTDELVKEGGGQDALNHADRIVMLPVLTGAVVFVADLIREMPMRLSMRVVTVSSYPGASTSSKGAMLRGALPSDLKGRHVVVVDDILDTGQTLGLLRDLILEQKPASLRIAVLLTKVVPRKVEVKADYSGFDIPDEFVVGYGLDYDGFYRNVPDIVVLEER
ncbi:MAG: hypoxanthine phosphoribosyltransferase [Phycisphaerales bacterium]